MGFLVRYLRASIVRTFGHGFGRSIEDIFITILSFFDNINPIAWGKVSTWMFHPGRYTGRKIGVHYLFFIRLLFLATNILTVSIQYSGILFAPATRIKGSWFFQVMGDAITDGIKYAGFTNHILQTVFLNKPQENFGRALINSSRHYMEDVQQTACLASVALVVVESVSTYPLYIFSLKDHCSGIRIAGEGRYMRFTPFLFGWTLS